MNKRTGMVRRTTNETSIELELCLDGSGTVEVRTGLGFLDHMFTALAHHARFDLHLQCKGDLNVDDHHTTEDCAIAFGQAFLQATGDRRGVQRFGYAYAPLDEALARAVVDLSGRPFATVNVERTRERIGDVSCENLLHVFQSLAMEARITLHIDVLRGNNDHHRIEAAFKALALSLRQAVSLTTTATVPSTKGVLC